METGKYVSKTADFAGNCIPGVGMYSQAKPSDYLKVIMGVREGNLDFSAEETERIVARLPEQMVGVKADSKGRLDFSVYKKADFLSPTNPNGSSVVGSGVVPILVADTIMEGAMPYTAAREVLETYRVKSSTEQIPFFSARKAAKKIAPNADAADLAEGLGKTIAEVDAYKIMCTMDKGLLLDASVDIKAAALREMGAAVEVALEETAVKCVVDNAYGTMTASATAEDALKSLVFASAQVGTNGFRASGALVAPFFKAHCLVKMAVPAYNDRAQDVGESGNILRFAGLDIGETGASSLAWGSANDVGAVVVDKTRAAHIIMREDMSFDEYDNVTKYALQPTIVSRFTVVAPVDKDNSKLNNKGAMVAIKETA